MRFRKPTSCRRKVICPSCGASELLSLIFSRHAPPPRLVMPCPDCMEFFVTLENRKIRKATWEERRIVTGDPEQRKLAEEFMQQVAELRRLRANLRGV